MLELSMDISSLFPLLPIPSASASASLSFESIKQAAYGCSDGDKGEEVVQSWIC